MEESARRKERLEALRREASQNPNSNSKDQSTPELLSNPLNDLSPSPSPSLTPQSSSGFDYYTDPLSAFSGNKKNKSIDGSSPNPNSSPRVMSYGNSSTPFKDHVQERSPLWQPNFHGSPQNPPRPFGSPVSGYYNEFARVSSSSDGSPVPRFNQTTPGQPSSYPSPQQQQPNQNVGLQLWQFSNPDKESNVTRFSQSTMSNCWPQQSPHLQKGQNGSDTDWFSNSPDEDMSNGSRLNQTPNQIKQPDPQPQNQQNQSGSQSLQFLNPSTENLMRKFNQVPNREKFLPQQPHAQPSTPLQPHNFHQRHQYQSFSQPRYNASPGRGSPWSDPRQSTGGRGRGSPSPSLSPSPGSGGRGISLSEPRRGSGGRGSPWMNSRGRGGRGQMGSPSPNQMRGGQGNHVNASARERPDLFVKKSMVEDPWKNLVPVLIDSLKITGVGNAWMWSRGNCSDVDSPGSSELRSASLKKAKLLQVNDNFQSGPSLAESLALALADAVGKESCS